MKKLAITLLVCGLCSSITSAQDATKTPAPNPEALVLTWLKQLNAMADWDGKGDPKAVVDRFMELYDPGVLQFTGPNENQLGSVTYTGMEGVRHWAEWFARTHSKSEYRIQVQTQKMKTADLVLSAAPPWGGQGLAVEITAFYTIRESQRKFAAPGAAFFVLTPEGKINRMRLYLLKDEMVEVLP